MQHLIEAFGIAVRMIVSGDPIVYSIALRTLLIASTSTIAASVLFVPLGCLLHFGRFRGRNLAIGLAQTLYSVPTVFVGMLVFILVSRSGPIGGAGLLFTPWAIILGEIVLIAPIITGLTISALKGVGKGLSDTATALGAGRVRVAIKVLTEAKYAVLTALLMGFGRAVSEVGIAIMVGGNISGYTRTLTTAIALGVGKGETAPSIALGLILLALAMLVSVMVNLLQGRSRR